MISSMTGFGEGAAAAAGVSVRAEVRSVNARHLDVKVRLPQAMAAREADVKALLRERFARGRLKVRLEVERTAAEDTLPVAVDEEAAAAYAALLRRLKAAAGLDVPIRLDDLLHFSDVLESPDAAGENAAATDAAWRAAGEALGRAMDSLAAARRREGEALHRDLAQRLDAIEGALEAIEARAPERVEEHRERLRERLDELFADERIAEERLEAEIALTADKLDVTEECVRLRSHLAQFRETLAGEGPAGRRLKFLTQELHREANTIGAKANDAGLSRHAIAIKEEIEKIREQIRNVE